MAAGMVLLLSRVAAEKVPPFEVRAPNRTTRAAIEAGERGEVSRAGSVINFQMRTRCDWCKWDRMATCFRPAI